jgi:acetolactate synthase-1/2/3 large subunit
MRVSDYIVEFLEKNGVEVVFTITGGFAMHMNDSFGRSNIIRPIYQHHEQACGYSAVGYSKSTNKPSVVCTTAGVAATNAISPCLVAYQDSNPVLFISGQVKSSDTIRRLNINDIKLRHYAGADCDIISAVSSITKFSHEIVSISEIPDILAKTYESLVTGRPGPVWLSIPVDIQGMDILLPFPKTNISFNRIYKIDLDPLYKLLQESKRPLLLVGNGVKLSECSEIFKEFVDKYKIPFVVTMLSSDLIETDHLLNCGKVGLLGDRCGNFTIQNSDLIVTLGCRMAQGIIGYRADWFARSAKIVYVDNDTNELAKDNLTYSLKINSDLRHFFNVFACDLPEYNEWITKTIHWKNKWLFEMPPIEDSKINPYYALKELYSRAPSNKITIASSGSIVTNVWHMLRIKSGDRFILSSQGDMGFELPAAIGSQIAEPSKPVITILGEGSLQLNIQELQTILHYKLPIKILVFNNASYGAISVTQINFFKSKFGVDESSGISFPDTEKISNAYGIKYIASRAYEDLPTQMQTFIDSVGPVLLEVFCCVQARYPRLSAVKNDDGTFTNRPLEDMFPFMDRKEFFKEMLVDII